MPYEGSALVMDVLLPSRVDGLADLEKSLTPAALDGWLAKLEHPEVNVVFPKFKLTEEADLGAALSTLGMPLAFSSNGADFSGMNGTHELFLSAVLHKAYVDVNEVGDRSGRGDRRRVWRHGPARRSAREFQVRSPIRVSHSRRCQRQHLLPGAVHGTEMSQPGVALANGATGAVSIANANLRQLP